MPRRPARTSNAGRESEAVFSSKPIARDGVRTIEGWHVRGSADARVVVCRTRDGERKPIQYIFAAEVEVWTNAIEYARTGPPAARGALGFIKTAAGSPIEVWACVDPRGGRAVVFGRRREDGSMFGASHLSGEEVDGLEAALSWLKEQ